MRIEHGGIGPVHIYIVIGDGRREERILNIVAKRFNHSKTARIPEYARSVKGLKASIEKISLLSQTTKVSTYIVLIDKEHIGGVEDIEKLLKEYGFEVIDIENIGDNLIRASVRRGPRTLSIYIVIFGYEKYIEEHLAHMIRILYGVQIKPDKNSIDMWLKQSSIRDIDLVEEALKKNLLKEAFPQLVKLFNEIARDP